MSKSRIKNSAKNVIYGCLGYFIGLLLAFISKHQFIRILGSEFNGLNGLFTNILNIMNVVELGFGGAIVFALYLPLKNKNHYEISQIINFIKKIYLIISISLFSLGLISISFIKHLIHEDINRLPFSLLELYLFYLLFLINNSLNYLLSHRRILLLADQKNYHVTNIDNSTTVVMHILQIVMLIVFEKNRAIFAIHYKFSSYMVFLGLLISKTFIRNIIILFLTNKIYPYLKAHKQARPEKTTKVSILKKVKSMTFHKSSEAILNGSTTIIISTLIGITQTGIYGNYMMIIMNIITLVNIFYNALLASVGNLSVSSSLEKQYDIFNKLHFLTQFIAYIVFISLFVLLNDFINIWIKSEIPMIFDRKTLFALCLFAYISIIRKSVTTFRDAKGLFSKDTYKSVFEVLIGIPISIIFALEFGVIGAVSGYCFAVIIVSIPTETRTLFNFGFKKSARLYYFYTFKNFLLSLISAELIYEVTNLIPYIPKLSFILKTIVSFTITIAVFCISHFYTNEFKYYIKLSKKALKKRVSKNNN